MLVSVDGPSPVSVPLAPPGPLTIGRSPDCDVVLSGDPRVSRRHAELTGQRDADAETRTITDPGSRHGTWLDGMRLATAHRVLAANQDLIDAALPPPDPTRPECQQRVVFGEFLP
jgi:hypothetical protein